MRLLALAAAALLLAFPRAAPAAVALSNCGTDRPDVQTLTDQNAGDLDTAQLIGVNLSTLAAVPVPNGLASGTRYNPYETTIWATVGQLVQAQVDGSGAIELTLRDPDSGDTVIAIFPDTVSCAASADPAQVQDMQQARDAFVQAYGTPPTTGTMALSGEAVVAGVGFIPSSSEPNQGGSGSGIELSPVLGFAPVPSSPAGEAPATSPTATPPAASSPTATPAAPSSAPTPRGGE